MTSLACCRWAGTTLILQLAVQPGAKQDELAGMHGERFKVRIKAPAVEGRANDRLIDFLAESFHVPRGHVQVVRGATSRMKTVQIVAPQQIPDALQRLAGQPVSR